MPWSGQRILDEVLSPCIWRLVAGPAQRGEERGLEVECRLAPMLRGGNGGRAPPLPPLF